MNFRSTGIGIAALALLGACGSSSTRSTATTTAVSAASSASPSSTVGSPSGSSAASSTASAAGTLAGSPSSTGESSTTSGSPASSVDATSPDATSGSSAATAAPSGSAAPTGSAAVALKTVATFDAPILMAIRPSSPPVVYLGQRAGKVLRMSDKLQALDIVASTDTDSEHGLLGLAFSPDASLAYVSYTDTKGDSRIDEYHVAPDGTFDTSTKRNVILIDQPYDNHNGGNIVFGPDGYLYAGFGDGGSANDPERRGLNGKTLLGKLLRIDPQHPSGKLGYTVPPDNPFVGQSGVQPEIWAIGLRNPWRYSFDPANGDLWIGDVGQGAWEEVDHVAATNGKDAGKGLNFGWSAYEGTHVLNQDQSAPDQTPPIFEYPHGDDGCSITGGYLYRGKVIPALDGLYIYGDYCSGDIWSLTADGTTRVQLAKLDQLASFGRGTDGEIYALSQNGTVAELTPA